MANRWTNPRDAAAHMASLAIEDIGILQDMLSELMVTMVKANDACRDSSHDLGSVHTADMCDAIAVMARAHRRMGAVTAFVTLGFYQEEAGQ